MIEQKIPIDAAAWFKKLWPHRKKYYVVLPLVFVFTYLMMVCIPRYYQCKVSLAPEVEGPSMSGSLGSLASSFGLGASLAKMASQDAIFVDIYPDVISSKDFIKELVETQVTTKDGSVKTTYYDYLDQHQKAPWWSYVMSALTGWMKPKDTEGAVGGSGADDSLSVMRLTKRQDDLYGAVGGNITCTVDKKTSVVTIMVKDQDPLVSAIIADATCRKLQSFITDYRTNKARIDYEHYAQLCEESKRAYDQACQDYAGYADSNREIVMARYKVKEDALENDMQTKYSIYTAMSTQLRAAASKLQEATPAFTMIENAVVPITPAGPKRVMMAVAMTILSFFVLTGWLIVKVK